MFEPVFWWNPKTFSAWNLCFNHPQVFRKIRPSTIPNPGGNLGFSFELSRPRAHVWPLRVSVHLEMLRLEGKVTKHRKLLLGCADCVHEHSWEMGGGTIMFGYFWKHLHYFEYFWKHQGLQNYFWFTGWYGVMTTELSILANQGWGEFYMTSPEKGRKRKWGNGRNSSNIFTLEDEHGT